jgi:hypothetical protein
MIARTSLRAIGAAVTISLVALTAGAQPTLGYAFAARASVSPTQMFVGDSAGTLLTFTVRNTGTARSLGAVEISRPFSFWTVLSCPSAPAGWSAIGTASDCEYRSASGVADDIAPHGSATFTLVVATAASNSNRAGTWRVIVSQTNDFDQAALLKQAAATSPGLKTTAYSFEVTDVVIADVPATIGNACPASNKEASSGTATVVVCGVNHTNAVQRTRARYTHLTGSAIKSPGTWHGGVVSPSPSNVVLGYWSNVRPWAGSGLALTAKIGAFPGRTSPATHLGGYSAPPAPEATVIPATFLEAGKDGQSARFFAQVKNVGNISDSYTLSESGSWTGAFYDATCTTPMPTTATLDVGDSVDVCVLVSIPANALEQETADATLIATSSVTSSTAGSATVTAMAVQFDVLIVDGDSNSPGDSAGYYEDALDANGVSYGYWDLQESGAFPTSYLNKHIDVIWFTGNTESGPLSAYETRLTGFLDQGGRLVLSGQDILDGAPGTSTFVQDYLHVDWDGTEVQNDKATTAVHSVDGNPVTDGIGDVIINHAVLGTAFEDQITPTSPADAAFLDDHDKTDALTVSDDGYKVVFMAFPFEAYGNASEKADLMNRVLVWFGA